MERTRGSNTKLSEQVKNHAGKEEEREAEFEGNTEIIVSTGSTELDLAISGGRIRGGGIPGGIMVEIFGPSSSGKTVLLCEIAGNIQRELGKIMFNDPEGRLNKQFAKMFGLNTNKMEYGMPDTVTEVFQAVRKWKPGPTKYLHGVFADSLAALSTDLEMSSDDGDKMGQRRAKEFSEECRKTCRILTRQNYLMVCSNQVRQNQDAVNKYAPKFKAPGGEAVGFYSSLRLRCYNPQKIKTKRTIAGEEMSVVTGIETEVEVFKSSIWKPFRKATVIIDYDYGIDDIRRNLEYLKTYKYKKENTYCVGGEKLNNTLERAIHLVELNNLENKLREEVIDLWIEIESNFERSRKPKRG